MTNMISKLALGSAQWGLDYGISNAYGKSTTEDVRDILTFAKTHSIELIDTAQGYGDAELRIANSGVGGFKLVSKISIKKLDFSLDIESAMAELACRSLAALNSPKIYGLLIHDVDALLSFDDASRLVSALSSLKQRQIVEKVGISVYSSSQVNDILNLFVPDIVQLPINIFDQRMVRNNTLSRLISLGVEVHARSVFLQGLILMPPNTLNEYFYTWKDSIADMHRFCKEHQLCPRDLALGYVCSLPEIAHCIVGVQNVTQLSQLVQSPLLSRMDLDCSRFFIEDDQLLNPSLWHIK